MRKRLRDAVAEAAAGTPARFDLVAQGRDGRLLTLDFSLLSVTTEDGHVMFLLPAYAHEEHCFACKHPVRRRLDAVMPTRAGRYRRSRGGLAARPQIGVGSKAFDMQGLVLLAALQYDRRETRQLALSQTTMPGRCATRPIPDDSSDSPM